MKPEIVAVGMDILSSDPVWNVVKYKGRKP